MVIFHKKGFKKSAAPVKKKEVQTPVVEEQKPIELPSYNVVKIKEDLLEEEILEDEFDLDEE